MLRLITILFLFAVQIKAGAEDSLDSRKIFSHLDIRFTNHSQEYNHTDSVLIIFDRCDRTAAGCIYRVYYPGKAQRIEISSIPVGRYYVTILHLGFHNDRSEKTIRIRKRKRTLRISLQATDEFIAGNTVIPSTPINLMRLKIWTMK